MPRQDRSFSVFPRRPADGEGGEPPIPGDDGTIPVDSIVGVGSLVDPDSGDDWETNNWNYVTIWGGFYFYMNNCKEVGPQTVTICRQPPKAKYFVWCSTCKCGKAN